MKNSFVVDGEVTRVLLSHPSGEKIQAFVDTKHLEKLNRLNVTWIPEFEPRSGSYYAVANFKKAKNTWTTIRLHRFLLDAPKNKIVDHINHNTLDNRECNLRIVTNLENMQNRRGAQVNSKTGIRGVSWDKYKRKWRATLAINKKQIFIGRFDSIHEAEQAVIAARKKYMPYSQEAMKVV